MGWLERWMKRGFWIPLVRIEFGKKAPTPKNHHMRKFTLIRTETSDQGTFGEIHDENDRFICVTAELPWRNNTPCRSCIPDGTYNVYRAHSEKFGKETYRLADVPERTAILIHEGNLAGDVAKGYESDVLGCIAPGMAIGEFKAGNKPAGEKDQTGVTSSRRALAVLEQELDLEPFQLEIKWGCDA